MGQLGPTYRPWALHIIGGGSEEALGQPTPWQGWHRTGQGQDEMGHDGCGVITTALGQPTSCRWGVNRTCWHGTGQRQDEMGLDGYVARTAQNSNIIYCKKHNQLLGQTITVPSFLAMGYLMFDNTTYKHSRLYHTVYSRSKKPFPKIFNNNML